MKNYQPGDMPVSDYRIDSFLGEGGYGCVYKVVNVKTGIPKALKVIELKDTQGYREYTALGLFQEIRHPHLVPIDHFWLRDEQGHEIQFDDFEIIVEPQRRDVELLILQGLGDRSLADLLKEYLNTTGKGIPVDDLMDYMHQVAKAIDFLNTPKIIGSRQNIAIQHGDIKPGNMMLVGGTGIQLGDCGLAQAISVTHEPGQSRTTDENPAGTPEYAAPEVVGGKPSRTSDQYSLAISYYEMRTGKLPFDDRNNRYACLADCLDFSLVPPVEQEVLQRAAHLHYAQRYPSCLEFYQAIKQAHMQAGIDMAIAGGSQALTEAAQTIDEKKESPAEPLTTSLESSQARTEDTKQPRTTQVGPYKLLQLLGEGGMGSVWDAEQIEPVRRRVALKLIKVGMASKTVLARFEAERQAMALMDHPHIAKILDAGTTDEGQPYFVMEQVKGLPITKYCDEAKLTLRERLKLFIPVCQAIQHAHEKGIIHRDLKPSNILIGLYDNQPVPKVIDFGVAKALHQPLTERTLYTEMGMILGTPEYMAPEQAEINALAIDARADIYSLGVILYELFTGSTPFDKRLLQQGALFEMLRMIREVEPPTPSQKLTSLDTLADAARNRRTEPHQLSRLIKGDLDWIAMKCLEKERDRRYDKANSLALDIERYLQDEVVQARPPSSMYRLKKWVRRHRASVIAGGLVFLSLLGAITGITWGLIHANSKHQDAVSTKDSGTEAVPTRSVEDEVTSKLKDGEIAHAIRVVDAELPKTLKVGDRVDVEADKTASNNHTVLTDVEVLHIDPKAPRSISHTNIVLLRLTRQQGLLMKTVQDANGTVRLRLASDTSVTPNK